MIEDVFGLYRTLELPTDASLGQIKKAYRSLALKYHPDKNPHYDAEIKFKAISAAYKVLSDPAQRCTYDKLKVNENNEVVVNGPPTDVTSDTVIFLGIILGHLIAAGAYSILPLPALLTYFLAPTIGALAVGTLDNIYTNGGEKKGLPQCSNTMKIGVGMFVSPLVPLAVTAHFALSLMDTVEHFIANMKTSKEYSTISLQMKLEEELENDWVEINHNHTHNDVIDKYRCVSLKKQQQHCSSNNWYHTTTTNQQKCTTMLEVFSKHTDMCEEEDFVLV